MNAAALVWVLMTVPYHGAVTYSPHIDLPSCVRLQQAAREADSKGFLNYAKCVQISSLEKK